MSRQISPVRDAALVVAGVVMTLLALLSLLGSVSRFFDLLTHAALVFLALSVIGLALSAGLKGPMRNLCIWLFLAAIGGYGGLVWPDALAGVADHPAPSSTAHRQVRLVDMNLWNRNTDIEATVSAILAGHPDVITLQEADDSATPVVERLRPRFPYVVNDRWGYGNYVMSRWPIEEASVIADRRLSILALFETGLTASLVSPPGEPPFLVATLHTGHPDAVERPYAVREGLAEIVNRFDTRSTILTGDFNLTPWSFAMRRQDAQLAITRRTHALPTWPAQLPKPFPIPVPVPFLPIDQVYAGSDWRTVSVMRGPRAGSDHYPVFISLER